VPAAAADVEGSVVAVAVSGGSVVSLASVSVAPDAVVVVEPVVATSELGALSVLVPLGSSSEHAPMTVVPTISAAITRRRFLVETLIAETLVP